MYNRPLHNKVFLKLLRALSGAGIVMLSARMVFADRLQINAACSKALCCTLALPIPVDLLGFCQSPDDTRHLVG